jgi:RimJ/RimL family protein N-acetyltransferase
MAEADVPDLVRGSNDPDVRHYARAWFPVTVEARNKQRADNMEIGQKSDGIAFVIKLVGDDRPIGMVSLNSISWVDKNCWLGLGIGDKSLWGKGIAVDAGALVLDYAFGELGLHKVITGIFQPNTRSQHAAAKAGFVFRGKRKEHIFVDGTFVDAFTYELMRDDWIKNRAGVHALIRRYEGITS